MVDRDESLAAEARVRSGETKRRRSIEAIGAAASELFYRNGYRAVTLEDIARRSGKSVATMHNHFETKIQVGGYVLDSTFMSELDRHESDDEPAGNLNDSLAALVRSARLFPDIGPALVQQRAQAGISFAELTPELYEHTHSRIRTGQGAGEVRVDIEPAKLTELCIGLGLSTVSLLPETADQIALASSIVLRGISSQS